MGARLARALLRSWLRWKQPCVLTTLKIPVPHVHSTRTNSAIFVLADNQAPKNASLFAGTMLPTKYHTILSFLAYSESVFSDEMAAGNDIKMAYGISWNNPAFREFNTLKPRQNGRHFADDIFKCIFLNENVWILLKISLKFVPKVPINKIPTLVQILAWRRPGDKPLSEPMLVILLTHICVTWPQWVKHSDYVVIQWCLKLA